MQVDAQYFVWEGFKGNLRFLSTSLWGLISTVINIRLLLMLAVDASC